MCFGELFKAGRESVKLPMDFPTYEDLESWYELHNYELPEGNLCDDYSKETQLLAFMDGYLMSECLVNDGKVYETQIFTNPDGNPDINFHHIANMARITSPPSLYYVDINWRKLVKLSDLYPGGKY